MKTVQAFLLRLVSVPPMVIELRHAYLKHPNKLFVYFKNEVVSWSWYRWFVCIRRKLLLRVSTISVQLTFRWFKLHWICVCIKSNRRIQMEHSNWIPDSYFDVSIIHRYTKTRSSLKFRFFLNSWLLNDNHHSSFVACKICSSAIRSKRNWKYDRFYLPSGNSQFSEPKQQIFLLRMHFDRESVAIPDCQSGLASLWHTMPRCHMYYYSMSVYGIKEHPLIRILYTFYSAAWNGIVKLDRTCNRVGTI